MKKWDGRYRNTYESKEPLEKDIERAMEGRFCYETSDGGTVREKYGIEGLERIDVYGPSESNKGHSHTGMVEKDGMFEIFHHD